MKNNFLETGKLLSNENDVNDLIEVLQEYKDFYGNQKIKLYVVGFPADSAQFEYFLNGITISINYEELEE